MDNELEILEAKIKECTNYFKSELDDDPDNEMANTMIDMLLTNEFPEKGIGLH